MDRRAKLRDHLIELVGEDAVFYQPKEGENLPIPCILYEVAGKQSKTANNSKYINNTVYKVTIMYNDILSDIPNSIYNMKHSSWVTKYKSNNVYHEIFNVYV